MKKILLLTLSTSVLFFAGIVKAAKIDYVTVKTSAPSNKRVKVHYRVPENYKPKADRLYRVLVFFGGRNCTGEGPVNGGIFKDWADELDIFIVSPGFTDDDYWHPKKWSGKALLKALAKIKKKYNISDKHLMFYGYSGGSQCANLYPAWKPKLCTAWVSHACGVWHKPSKKMRGVPGLATCGEADAGRYFLTQRFAMECRRKGLNVLWKSFPNTPHDVPPASAELARVFLKHHHLRNLADLKIKGKEAPGNKDKVIFVGDDQEGRYWPVGSKEISYIDIEDRVEFTSKELADAWGKEAKSRWALSSADNKK